VTGRIALRGALIFIGYRLGDAPDETRQIIKLDADFEDERKVVDFFSGI
jgi:hypothetical protein